MNIKRLFHIHKFECKNKPFFELGKIYNTFDSNNFWEFYKTYSPYITFDDKRYIKPARYALSCVEKNEIHPIGLKYLSDALYESGMLIRELIFEEVRKQDYNNSPSRRNCIWLTEEENIEFWLKWIKQDGFDYKIYEFECEGNFHKGNQDFLDSEIVGYNEYYNNAVKYWSGESTNIKRNNEIIFNGEIKVIDILK